MGGEQAGTTVDRWMVAREGGEKSNVLHEEFLKLGAPLTIVLVCFAQEIGIYIERGELPISISISNMVLIDVTLSIFINRHN